MLPGLRGNGQAEGSEDGNGGRRRQNDQFGQAGAIPNQEPIAPTLDRKEEGKVDIEVPKLPAGGVTRAAVYP